MAPETYSVRSRAPILVTFDGKTCLGDFFQNICITGFAGVLDGSVYLTIGGTDGYRSKDESKRKERSMVIPLKHVERLQCNSGWLYSDNGTMDPKIEAFWHKDLSKRIPTNPAGRAPNKFLEISFSHVGKNRPWKGAKYEDLSAAARAFIDGFEANGRGLRCLIVADKSDLVDDFAARLADVPRQWQAELELRNKKLLGNNASHFFKLSAEMRNTIYRLVLVEPNPIDITTTTTTGEPGLLRSCWIFRWEALEIYYRENAFGIMVQDCDASQTLIAWSAASKLYRDANLRIFLTGTPNWSNLKHWMQASFEGDCIRLPVHVPQPGQNGPIVRMKRAVGQAFETIMNWKSKQKLDWNTVSRMLNGTRHMMAIVDDRWSQ